LTERVLVLGLGVSGHEVARILAERGATILASDTGDVGAQVRADLEALGVDVESGGHDRARAELDTFDLIFPSPGISPMRGFLQEVIAAGRTVVSELDLATRITDVPVVAVTGTNGKTTVCRLAEAIGREAGLDVYACGNLETKFITAADTHPGADVFVVEASSFSLAFAETFRPRAAVVTSLAPDHLDWHGTFEHYRDSKARIAARQTSDDLFLYPAAQPELEALAPAGGPERVAFDALSHPGVEQVAARGRHFAADAAAASEAMAFVARIIEREVGADAIERALDGFTFDRHRIEPVGSRDGVAFYDDSVATNTHATLAAIDSMPSDVVLIAGGRNKGIDLSPLASAAARLRAVIAIGEASSEVADVFRPTGVFVGMAASMREAVAMAIERAEVGDVVLLSPACASHDMYRNYAERGEDFIAVCRELGVRPS
jgi:UDP-N-acetylmuramoylalanine--D-glutamate ligase